MHGVRRLGPARARRGVRALHVPPLFRAGAAGDRVDPTAAAAGGRGPRRGLARREPGARPLRGRAPPDRSRVDRPRRAHDPRPVVVARRPPCGLLSGERPDAADLVEIQPPSWFAGAGWGLSLERAADGGPMPAERTAWIRGGAGEAVLLLAGEPTDAAAAAFECALALGGARLDARLLREPWLAAYYVGPPGGDAYAPLVVHDDARAARPPKRPSPCAASPSGRAAGALVVHGAGWHYPETDRDGRLFRWASGTARSLVHVPPGGGRVVVEGEVPPRHVALPVTVTLESGGQTARVGRERPLPPRAGGRARSRPRGRAARGPRVRARRGPAQRRPPAAGPEGRLLRGQRALTGPVADPAGEGPVEDGALLAGEPAGVEVDGAPRGRPDGDRRPAALPPG